MLTTTSKMPRTFYDSRTSKWENAIYRWEGFLCWSFRKCPCGWDIPSCSQLYVLYGEQLRVLQCWSSTAVRAARHCQVCWREQHSPSGIEERGLRRGHSGCEWCHCQNNSKKMQRIADKNVYMHCREFVRTMAYGELYLIKQYTKAVGHSNLIFG